jgi:hypothetical protein
MKSTLHFTNFHATRWALAPLASLGLTLSSCGIFAVKDQQDAMLANMARQQQELKAKQAAQTKTQFAESYDSNEDAYAMMRSKIELYESQYQDWIKGVTPAQKRTNEFATTTKTHDEIKGRADKMEDEHGALVQWYEKTKESPTTDDSMKLSKTYGSFSQKSQLLFSNYADLSSRTMSISAKNK